MWQPPLTFVPLTRHTTTVHPPAMAHPILCASQSIPPCSQNDVSSVASAFASGHVVLVSDAINARARCECGMERWEAVATGRPEGEFGFAE